MTDTNHDVAALIDWLRAECINHHAGYQCINHHAGYPADRRTVAEKLDAAADALARVTAERDAAVGSAEAEGEESYQIGLRDGYEQGVQKADEVTGGNGEYVCCVGADPDDRHCPGPAEMLKRMAERWDAAHHAPEPAPAAGDVVSRAAVLDAISENCFPDREDDPEYDPEIFNAEQSTASLAIRIILALPSLPSPASEPAALPKLTTGMIEAAFAGHYGKHESGIHGAVLTSSDVDYTFAQAFHRMWSGVRKHLAHAQEDRT